jgi:hypothetical protein
VKIFYAFYQNILNNQIIFFKLHDSEENNLKGEKELKRANTSLINLKKLDDDFILPENGKW